MVVADWWVGRRIRVFLVGRIGELDGGGHWWVGL